MSSTTTPTTPTTPTSTGFDWKKLGSTLSAINPLIGLGTSLFGDLFGGLFGASSASSQAESYLKGIQETNAMNYKIWHEQKLHNLEMYNLQKQDTWDMWNAENEYNSASAQRKRLEEAGYNPMLAIGGMSGNTAGSMSTPQMQGTQMPMMQAPGIEAYNNGASVYAQMALNVKDTFSNFANQYALLAKLPSEISLNEANAFQSRTLAQGYVFDNVYKEQMSKVAPWLVKQKVLQEDSTTRFMEEQIKTEQNLHDIQIAEKTFKMLSNHHQQIINDYIGAERFAQLQLMVQQFRHNEIMNEREAQAFLLDQLLGYANLKLLKNDGKISDDAVAASAQARKEMEAIAKLVVGHSDTFSFLEGMPLYQANATLDYLGNVYGVGSDAHSLNMSKKFDEPLLNSKLKIAESDAWWRPWHNFMQNGGANAFEHYSDWKKHRWSEKRYTNSFKTTIPFRM